MSHIDPVLPEASDPQPVSSVAPRQSRQPPPLAVAWLPLSETALLRHRGAQAERPSVRLWPGPEPSVQPC